MFNRLNISIVVILAVVAPAWADSIRFYITDSDTHPNEFWTNQTIVTDAGTGNYYLWAHIPQPSTWNGVSLQVNSFGTATGSVTVFNPEYLASTISRWDAVSIAGDLAGSTANAASVTALGLANPIPSVDTEDTYPTDNVYLFGRIQVTSFVNGGSLFIGIGDAGISRHNGTPGEDYVFFGWADEPLANDDFGAYSQLPDLRFIPEPATLGLVVLGAVALLRRDRR